MKRPNILWLVALFLGWAFDFLFWKHEPGIAFAIYVVLCLAGGFILMQMEQLKPSWKSLLLLVPILFFAVMTFIRQEPLTVFLSVMFTLLYMAFLSITWMGGRWPEYNLADYIGGLFRLAGSALSRSLIQLAESRKQAAGSGEKQSGRKHVWPILRGILIAIPVVVFFAVLLSSADLIFAQRLDDFVQLFRLEKLPEYIFRAIYILILALLLAGILLHAAQKSMDEKLSGLEKPLVPSFLGFTESAIVLGSVVALFAIFVAIQFAYFFGGQANINIEGYTYAEYARRGFGELVAVAFFSLLLFLGLSGISRRNTTSQRWVFSGLGIALVMLVGVMLVSAFQRLMLYEAAYGFSRLRTYTHVFMFWLGLLLAVVVVLEIVRRARWFANTALLAALGFAVTLSLLNVDAFIVRQNVERAVEGETLDVGYLASLSDDSVPMLVSLYQSDALPSGTRDAVGAALACISAQADGGETNWRSFHFSSYWSQKALDGIEDDLNNYKVEDDYWPNHVITPEGESYDCWSSWTD